MTDEVDPLAEALSKPAVLGAKLDWIAREPPLPVAAVLGQGSAAAKLAQALFIDDELRQRCVCVGHGDALVVIGADLPWVEGVVWLGRDDDLLVPTIRQAALRGKPVAPSLLSDALFRGRKRLGIAVLTPTFSLVASTPSGPPPSLLLAAGIGLAIDQPMEMKPRNH